MDAEQLAKTNQAIRSGKFGTAHQYALLKELERVQKQLDALPELLAEVDDMEGSPCYTEDDYAAGWHHCIAELQERLGIES